MGFFDYIGAKIQQANAEVLEAQMEAERWDARTICMKLKNCHVTSSSIRKYSGYMKALRSKCEEMNDWELKGTFDDAYNSRNARACDVMMSEMERRYLAYKDDNGKIVRTYRYR